MLISTAWVNHAVETKETMYVINFKLEGQESN